MGKGLKEYDQNDPIFRGAIVPRILLAGVFTGFWYLAVTKNRIFRDSNLIKITIPIAFLGSYFFARGFVYHLIALNAANREMNSDREKELYNFKRDLREAELEKKH
jgi:hypothetical protein